MHKPLAITALVPVIALAGAGAAHAANDPSEVVIPSLSASYVGPESSAGKTPQVSVVGSQVSRAFTKYLSYKNVAKVVRGTDGQATQKGSKVTVNGFRCKAKSFAYVNPGTAGQYSVVDWKCKFQAADTSTEIGLAYQQASL